MTHISNIPHILKYGIVRADSPNRNINYINIGDPRIIEIRKDLDYLGKKLSNFIPFYFGYRSPMLYVIQNGYNNLPQVNPEDIIYIVIRLEDLIIDSVDCVFTDGHALNEFTRFYPKDKLTEINNIISPADIFADQWSSPNDPDLKRRKEAELLVEKDLHPKYIHAFAVYNENAKRKLVDLNISSERIFVLPRYYYSV